jgi:hypothetical protein
MTTFDNKILPKLCPKYNCQNCDYTTSKKSSFNSHCQSKKHKNRLLTTNDNENSAKLCPQHYSCKNCEKTYKDRAGLWRHNKKCNKFEMSDDIDGLKLLHMENKEIIELLKQQMKENGELCKQLKSQNETINELASKVGTHTIHNKTFNLNLFLNETCKDALNITDFVKSIKLQLSDLEATGRLGYVEGISKILLHNLNGLDTHQRPIHCSDFKREILYIKDDNQWIKEDEDKLVLQNAIKHIASKNMKQIPEWVKCNPDCYNSDSKTNDKYLKIVSNSMSGSSKEEQDKNIHQIIKNLAKEVVIQK